MQKNYGIPWGISEAAFNLKDLNYNYQYKAFGIPWLGLKRGLDEDMVVSPYSVALSMQYDSKGAIENLRELEKQGMYNKYGFYESIDYTADRLSYGKTFEPVKTYMAHHQALILLSINNLINKDILVNRFSENPEIEAVDILLQERMPDKAIITKEKKEKVEKITIKDYESNFKKIYAKYDTRIKAANFISNGKYTVCSTVNGEGFSKYYDILINRFKNTRDSKQGIFFIIKNLNQNNIWNTYQNNNEKSQVVFESSSTEYHKTNGNIEAKESITVAPDEAIEIRRLMLKNVGQNFENLEITGYFEPVISRPEQDYSHMTFNNLFLNFEVLESGSILIKRNKRGESQEECFLGVSLYTEAETIGELEYEIDKEKFMGKGNNQIPEMVRFSKPYSKNVGLVTDPIIALKRTIKIPPGETVILDLLITIDDKKENIIDNLNKYENTNIITRTFELAKAKVEAENIYLGVKGKEIEIYQKMLSMLIFQNPTREIKMNNLPKRLYSQSELWKYGVSGDLPILLAKIKDINDIYIIYELLKAFEFFRTKNIKIDLIFLNEELNSYDNYIKFEIENAIQNRQLSYLKNQLGGIYIINKKDLAKKELELLEFRANLIIDSSLGNIKTGLQDIEEEYLAHTKEVIEERTNIIENEEKLQEKKEELKYYNEYGGFKENELEYKIRYNEDSLLPTTWCNILANKNFGTLITQNLGGFTWCYNSRLNRLSSWNNNPIQDLPSELICIKNVKTGKIWCLSQNFMKDKNDYSVTYGMGYTTLKTLKDGIVHDVKIFIPSDDKIKINIVNLKNTTAENKKIKMLYYIKPVLGEDEIKTNSYIDVSKDGNIVFIKNLYKDEFKSNIAYVSSNLDISAFTGKKRLVMNNGKIVFGNLDNKTGLGEDSCIAIELEIELKTFESKEIILMFGAEESILDIKNMVYKYSKLLNCNEELKKVKEFWKDILTRIQVKTPLESMNIMLNGWSVYQTIVSRLWSRTAYYQSGGAFGFRDQLQDTLCLKYIESDIMKNQILKHAKHQFIEGDVEHWWHDETGKGIRTRFSDDLLWLCYTTSEYLETTGDYKILEEEIPYLKGDYLEENVDERYDEYVESDIKESLYNHCIRAIEKSLDFGEHGLPKIGSGDWNDGLNTVGNKKRGESVWLGFFLYDVLTKFIKICSYKNDIQKINRYNEVLTNLKRALNNYGWDGRWFRRAYTDNGEPIGSIENDECRIDSLSQSWGVISGAADNDKKYISMQSLENHLIDRENGIIKLLDPPFYKTKIEPGYIKSYLPGVRENGGQYTHAAMWVIYAFTKLGFGDKALELYRMINPIEHSRTKDEARKYKVEPYVIPADIYSSENLTGRGGWTWYTGSSSWFYKIGIENILGMKIMNNILKFEPCIPKDWKEYSIKYRFKNSIYNIKVKNEHGKSTGVEEIYVNGQEIDNKEIILDGDGEIYEVEVIM